MKRNTIEKPQEKIEIAKSWFSRRLVKFTNPWKKARETEGRRELPASGTLWQSHRHLKERRQREQLYDNLHKMEKSL